MVVFFNKDTAKIWLQLTSQIFICKDCPERLRHLYQFSGPGVAKGGSWNLYFAKPWRPNPILNSNSISHVTRFSLLRSSDMFVELLFSKLILFLSNLIKIMKLENISVNSSLYFLCNNFWNFHISTIFLIVVQNLSGFFCFVSGKPYFVLLFIYTLFKN